MNEILSSEANQNIYRTWKNSMKSIKLDMLPQLKSQNTLDNLLSLRPKGQGKVYMFWRE